MEVTLILVVFGLFTSPLVTANIVLEEDCVIIDGKNQIYLSIL